MLVNITGVRAAPLVFSGLRFAGAAHTFLASHGVPSGGDWTLANNAAVIAVDTDGLVRFDNQSWVCTSLFVL